MANPDIFYQFLDPFLFLTDPDPAFFVNVNVKIKNHVPVPGYESVLRVQIQKAYTRIQTPKHSFLLSVYCALC